VTAVPLPDTMLAVAHEMDQERLLALFDVVE